jgi:hypothetical protein
VQTTRASMKREGKKERECERMQCILTFPFFSGGDTVAGARRKGFKKNV